MFSYWQILLQLQFIHYHKTQNTTRANRTIVPTPKKWPFACCVHQFGISDPTETKENDEIINEFQIYLNANENQFGQWQIRQAIGYLP